MDWERIESARERARFMLAIPAVAIAFLAFAWVAAPTFSEPSFGCAPPVLTTSGIVTNCGGAPTGIPLGMIPGAVGVLGLLVGFAWMWRIYRAPTRYEGAHWRFHDH